jgi:hypothetical protein
VVERECGFKGEREIEREERERKRQMSTRASHKDQSSQTSEYEQIRAGSSRPEQRRGGGGENKKAHARKR